MITVNYIFDLLFCHEGDGGNVNSAIKMILLND